MGPVRQGPARFSRQEIIMEEGYWLGRKRETLVLARNATASDARLIHYDLAGRYHLKALSAASAREASND